MTVVVLMKIKLFMSRMQLCKNGAGDRRDGIDRPTSSPGAPFRVLGRLPPVLFVQEFLFGVPKVDCFLRRYGVGCSYIHIASSIFLKRNSSS